MPDEEGPQAPHPKELMNLQLHKIPHPSNPQVPIVPNAPQAPIALHVLLPQMPQLNWSHFKPKYSGKPDKDAEAHLRRMNDWMDTQGFPDHIKVQRFCLNLVGEARL